jgi:type II secretory pathway pseudopilin PulG
MSVLRNNKILVAVIAAAAAAAAFWFLALSPKRKEAADLQSQIAAQHAAVQQAQQQIATYLKARDSYKADYAVLTRLGKAVPADDDIRSLMVQLNGAADSTHVDFAKLDVGGASGATATPPTSSASTGALAPPPGTVQVGTTGISALPFTLSFGGTYANLTDFFARLDRFVSVHNAKVRATGRLLRVETISLVPSSAGWPRMTADVGAATHLVAASGATPGASPTAPGGTTATPASTPTPSTPSTPSTTTATVTGAAR